MSETRRLLTLEDLMQWLQLSRATVFRLMKESGLPHLKLGHSLRFDPQQVEQWLAEHQQVEAKGGGEKALRFRDDEHETVFREALRLNGPQVSPEQKSALFLLALLGKEVLQFVAPGRIRFDDLMEAPKAWSSGERALAKLAAHLMDPLAWPCTVDEGLADLDKASFEAALEALRLRYR